VNKRSNFTQFEFVRFGTEQELLRCKTPKVNDKILEAAKMRNEGETYQAIADVLGCSEGNVRKMLKKAPLDEFVK
jgi:hypothetical protein